MEMYFVIKNSDGNTTVDQVTKEELLKRITPDEDGDTYYEVGGGFIERIANNDTNYWGDGILIIKGLIVVPTEKRVVTAFDVN